MLGFGFNIGTGVKRTQAIATAFDIMAGIPGLVSLWDFNESSTPFKAVRGVGEFPLTQGVGAAVSKVVDGPFGHAVEFNGSSDYLIIPADDCGALNIGRSGGNLVTVVGWVYRTNTTTGFIAGCWQEDDADPRRQYGLFVDLPLYGGSEQVCGHISRTGGPTEGYDYSRDYSSNSRPVPTSEWVFIAMTYDGSEIRSYYESNLERRPTYTDIEGQTYAKNPYLFADGLNTALCDFTVGAVKLTEGFSNWFGGRMGGIAVYNRGLTLAEITKIERAGNAALDPVYDFNFNLAASSTTGARPIGWRAVYGASAVDVTDGEGGATGIMTPTVAGAFSYIARGTGSAPHSGPAVAWCEDIAGIQSREITTVSFRLNNANTNDLVRLCVRIGANWYATNATYNSTVAGVSGSDWTNAETKTITFSHAAALWRDMTLTPGSTLSVVGSARSADLPEGELTGIGLLSVGTTAGAVRIDDLKVFC